MGYYDNDRELTPYQKKARELRLRGYRVDEFGNISDPKRDRERERRGGIRGPGWYIDGDGSVHQEM